MSAENLSRHRLEFLARLPLFLNSSLGTRRIINTAMEFLKNEIGAEAATVFLLDQSGQELRFWLSQSEQSVDLEGLRMPSDRGIVGWVLEQQKTALVDDVTSDERFFKNIDDESGFQTRNVLCTPLTVRGQTKLGAIQVLNSQTQKDFSQEDLSFLEQFAHQVALAIDNAKLYETACRSNDKLKSLDRKKNEVIRVISHEFRTPLSLIQGSAEMLATGSLEGNALESMADTLKQGVSRLTRLTSEISNLSLVSGNSLAIEKKRAKVVDLLLNIEKPFAEICEARDINFSVNNECPETEVSIDQSLFLVALQNLLSNAIRFTPDGGQISVKATSRAQLVTFSVKDSGIGIKESEIPLIFEKFYEVADSLFHSSGTYEFGSAGLGLGLATTKAIVDAHDGSLNVESSPKNGSTFSIRITSAA